MQEVDNYDEFYQAKLAELGYESLFKPKPAIEYNQQHGIAICYTKEFSLITHKWIDMNDMKHEFMNNDVLLRETQALFCLFRHQLSGKYLVVGNTHLFHDPAFDFVKHAQAVYLLKEASGFVAASKLKISLIDADFTEDSIAFVQAGDFNSLPMSSVMSVFHNEDITSNNPSMWQIPHFADQEVKDFYLASNKLLRQLESDMNLAPLQGNLNSAYNLYNTQNRSRGLYNLDFNSLRRAIND